MVLEEKETTALRKQSSQGASGYLWVRRGSVLHIQGQCLGTVTLSDQVSRIQSHVLVQNLVVLSRGEGKAVKGGGWDQCDQAARVGGDLRLWI